MIKRLIFIQTFFSAAVAYAIQPLSEVVPNIEELDNLHLRMKIAEFMEIRPKAIFPFPSESQSAEGAIDPQFSGILMEQNIGFPERDVNGGIAMFNFKKGKLASVFLANKELIKDLPTLVSLTASLRETLWKFHGDPKIGYVTKSHKDKVAKVSHEVFNVDSEGEIKIALASSFDGIEISIINYTLETEETTQNLFFDYEQKLKNLKDKGKVIAEVGEFPDHLADLIISDPKPTASIPRKPLSTEQKNPDTISEKNNLSNVSAGQGESSSESSKWSLVVAVMLLGFAILIFIYSRIKKS